MPDGSGPRGADLDPDRDDRGSDRLVPEGLDATLVLVRHGETEFIVEGRFQGRSPTPLTAIGRRQAALAGRRLAALAPAGGLAPLPVPPGEPLEIAHSPLRRTTETADAIAAAFADAGRPEPARRPEEGLTEIGQGEWEGLPGTEITARWPELLAAWRRDPTTAWGPGGESLVDVAARLRPGLASILRRLAAGRAPGPTDRSQVAGYAPPMPPDWPWTILVGHDGVFKVALLALLDLPPAAFWRFPFVLGGITIVEVRAGRPVIRAHNLADHLAPLTEAEPAQEAAAERAAAERERSGAL
ncbi:MAG TPA: histidine phosphatase family protein [Candidatus Limnocylindrales bacterium]|nr:histidine phosphatase family protein [Candidatus Limnocylindrales bacterium]